MYFGNSASRIEYQTANSTAPFSWGPPYGTTNGIPVSDQLAPFEDFSTTTSVSTFTSAYSFNLNSFIPVIPVIIIFLTLVLVLGYFIRKRGHNKNYLNSPTVTTNNNSTDAIASSNPIRKTPDYCYSCQALVSREDVFCSNCGNRL